MLERLLGSPTIDTEWQSIIDSVHERLKEDPDNTSLLNELAITQARAQQWDKCANSYSKLLEYRKDREEIIRSLASAFLLAGDRDSYEELCKDFRGSLGESPSARMLYLYSRAVASNLASLDDGALESADRSVSMEEKTWHIHTLALAHLQAGNWDDAISHAKRSLEKDGWDGDVCDWLVLAIALHEKGDKAESTVWLAKSDEWFRDNERKLNLEGWSGLPIHPHNWLAARVLLREAHSRLRKNDK